MELWLLPSLNFTLCITVMHNGGTTKLRPYYPILVMGTYFTSIFKPVFLLASDTNAGQSKQY